MAGPSLQTTCLSTPSGWRSWPGEPGGELENGSLSLNTSNHRMKVPRTVTQATPGGGRERGVWILQGQRVGMRKHVPAIFANTTNCCLFLWEPYLNRSAQLNVVHLRKPSMCFFAFSVLKSQIFKFSLQIHEKNLNSQLIESL